MVILRIVAPTPNLFHMYKLITKLVTTNIIHYRSLPRILKDTFYRTFPNLKFEY